MLAALPAIRRAVRMPLREALEATRRRVRRPDAAVDGALRRVSFLPRTAQIGLRSVGRRKRRSLSTALQIAFAVGTLLAVLGLGTSIGEPDAQRLGRPSVEVWVGSSMQRRSTRRAARLIRATPGVADAQPAFVNEVKLAGNAGFVWAVPAKTLFALPPRRRPLVHARRGAGASARGRARERDRPRRGRHASATRPPRRPPPGPRVFRVIGMLRNVQENGTVAFVPLDDDAGACCARRPPSTTTGSDRPRTTTTLIDRRRRGSRTR